MCHNYMISIFITNTFLLGFESLSFCVTRWKCWVTKWLVALLVEQSNYNQDSDELQNNKQDSWN